MMWATPTAEDQGVRVERMEQAEPSPSALATHRPWVAYIHDKLLVDKSGKVRRFSSDLVAWQAARLELARGSESLVPRGDVVLSPEEGHRFFLTRELGGARPLVSIGVNPSTADADTDDQTMRKEQGYARRWECGRLIKVNMYGYRATDIKDMWAAEKRGVDIVGAMPGFHNDWYILHAIQLAIEHDGIVLAAWGKHAKLGRVIEVLRKIHDRYPQWLSGNGLQCLGTNGDGSPKHTLYLGLALAPHRWNFGHDDPLMPRIWSPT